MNCTLASLSGLTLDCETSKGGIKEVYIANYVASAATAFKEAAPGATSASTLTGVTWYKYEFRRNTGSMTSTLNIDDANGTNYVSTDLVLNFGKMNLKKWTEMKALSLNELLVCVVDCNNEVWLLGLDEPVTASAGQGETGSAKSDANAYTITLTASDDTYPVNWVGQLPSLSQA